MALTSWLYNSNTGAVGQYSNAELPILLHSGTGWHGPFNSKQDALNYYAQYSPSNPGWKPPVDANPGFSNAFGLTQGSVAGGALDSIGSINIGNWLIRIGEILIGIVLIGVGVAKLTGNSNVVTSVVKAVK